MNVVNILGEEKALEYFDKLSTNIKQFTTSGSGPINLLKQGEIAVAMGMTFQGVEEINKGANVEIIELDTKTPYNTTSSGIIKGKDTDTVKKVFTFIMTDYLKYDKENFVPGEVLKEIDIKIKNYPTYLSIKEKLLKEWKY